METWLKLSLILCFFGFLKEIRPSEHFIYEYLCGPWRNLTEHQVVTQVYPVGTYGYLILLIAVFLITDFLRYKPLIIVIGLSGIIFSGMLIWTTSLLALQILEIFYATFMAAEVAYYTYIYAKVDKEYYPLVTSHTRATLLAGRFCSAASSQILISYRLMDYKQLNYITFSAMILATGWSFFIPTVKKSIYFNRPEDEEEITMNKHDRLNRGITLMKQEVVECFRNSSVVIWSIWYAFSLACFLQVQNYAQPLWSSILVGTDKTLYNGAVEAILTIMGFFAALLAGVLKVNWSKKCSIFLVLFSIFQGIVIILGAVTANIFISYMCYTIYGILYHFAITVTSSEIAKNINNDTYGLIFGINTFIAMIIQSLLTIIVVNDIFYFNLEVWKQYVVYGCFCFGIALIYIFISSVKYACKPKRNLNITI